MTSMPTVLIVDDEVRSLETLARILDEEFEVKTSANVSVAREILASESVQILLCDQRMPEMSGVEFLASVKDPYPDVIRIIISGYTDANDIIDAINDAGIYQYITKPWHPDNLLLTLRNAAHMYALQQQSALLSVELKMSPQHVEKDLVEKKRSLRRHYQSDDGIVRAKESCINDICAKIERVAAYDISVLLIGESGTGKELAARALHYNSPRWDKPFITENCAAMPDDLLESELFGYRKGAFTGAVEDRVGLFERANGGTVFLDEIGEVSPAFQVKLLRALQEGEIRPLGSNRTRKINVRVIAATNRDLDKDLVSGRFREDLYYRLATVVIKMPSLRERVCDIPILANYLLEHAMHQLGKTVQGYTDEAINCMQTYHWPGNVREMQNEIQHMLVMCEDELIGADLLSPKVLHAAPEEEEAELEMLSRLNGSLKQRIEALEARILKEILIRHRWNKSRAARELGLSRVGLRSKLERYGLEKVEQLKRAATS